MRVDQQVSGEGKMTLTPEEQDEAYHHKACNTKTKCDFIECLQLLGNDFTNRRDEWENQILEEYLEAASAITKALPSLYENIKEFDVDPEKASWRESVS
jgi:hypothetical protein